MADSDKFKRLVHYVCAQSPNPRSLGKTKLNKILWFAERDVYLRTGIPISGVKFIKMPYGPVPETIDEALNELCDERALVIRTTELQGKPKKEFISLREPSLDGFTADEVSAINRAVMAICNLHTAKSISDRSHDEIWKIAEMGEEIPLYATFGHPGQLQPEDVKWARRQLAEMQGAAA